MTPPLDYEDMVGLWLNHEFAMKRRAATVALGVSALLSPEVGSELASAI